MLQKIVPLSPHFSAPVAGSRQAGPLGLLDFGPPRWYSLFVGPAWPCYTSLEPNQIMSVICYPPWNSHHDLGRRSLNIRSKSFRPYLNLLIRLCKYKINTTVVPYLWKSPIETSTSNLKKKGLTQLEQCSCAHSSSKEGNNWKYYSVAQSNTWHDSGWHFGTLLGAIILQSCCSSELIP